AMSALVIGQRLRVAEHGQTTIRLPVALEALIGGVSPPVHAWALRRRWHGRRRRRDCRRLRARRWRGRRILGLVGTLTIVAEIPAHIAAVIGRAAMPAMAARSVSVG